MIVEEGAFLPTVRQSLNAKLSPAGEALPSIRTIQTISQWADKDHSQKFYITSLRESSALYCMDIMARKLYEQNNVSFAGAF